ncbi:MAG: hypothetical protein J5725_11920 [Bacteroidales bacterium]|nr:hypothetical protein [Bacteroidales bacterium]
MSEVTKPILLDETGQLIKAELTEQNKILRAIAGASVSQNMSLSAIHRIVQEGSASEVFSIGDQITVQWTDKATNTEYDVPLDIVHFGDVELQDGETVPAMFVQWHYCSPFGVQFDQREALYVVPSGGMSAGTYYFNVPSAWGKISAGNWQFTVDSDLSAGTQLVFDNAYVDVTTGLTNATISAYANPTSTTKIGTYTITSGNSGTYLGQMKASGDTNLNGMQNANYGYNRWSQSALRQFLNSESGANAWWSAQNQYDRVPSEIAKHGFLTGFSDEFLTCIQPIKVVTAKNTVTDDGALETTYDKIFLPSLSQINVNPQLAGEGDIWEKWKRQSGSSTPLAQGDTYPQMRTFAIENHASAQTVRLRSANRGNSYGTWYVGSSGYVSYGSSTVSSRFAPACAIC